MKNGHLFFKGACIIRMLYYINPEKFRIALQRYICLYQYKTAETNDLWDQVSEQMDGIPVSKIMSTWTSQPGFPLINVYQINGALSLIQERFLIQKKNDKSK